MASNQNTIRVDRGVLFEVLLAAEAALEGPEAVDQWKQTTPAERIAGTRAAAEDLRDALLG